MTFVDRWPRCTHALLAGTSAALASVALPPYGLWWMAWIAWVPWFAFNARASRKGIFAATLVALWVQLFASMTWVDSLLVGGTVLVSLLAFPFAVLPALLLARIARARTLPWVALPLAMITADLLREVVLGACWAGAGHSQWRWSEGLQSAAIFRGHWLSFVVLAGNGVLAFALMHWSTQRAAALKSLALIFALVALTHLGGSLSIRDDFAEGPRVLGIQPAIPQAIKMRHSSAAIWDRHRLVLEEVPAKLRDADILVFPETTFPPLREPDRTLPLMLRQIYREDSDGLHAYNELLPRGRGQLSILGTVRHLDAHAGAGIKDADGNGHGEMNVALVVRNGAELMGENPKRYLVPFGEYVPWPEGWPGHADLLALVRDVGGYVPDMTAGSTAPLFQAPSSGEPLFGITICFEVAFPSEFGALAERGATFIINTSNDAWFTQGAEQELVDIAVRFRAAEARRAVFRVSNAGISALIDPCGREVASVSAGGQVVDVAGALHGCVPLNDERTPASRWGALPSTVFPAVLLILWWRRRKP